LVLFAVPTFLGATGLDRGSGGGTQQALIETAFQPKPASLQSSNLSQLRGGLETQDFDLTADVTIQPAFAWPASGNITSYMDSSHPMGIDIGLDYDEDSPVLATAAGTVQFAGGSDSNSYGYYVIVDHGGGLQTLYGHFSDIVVTTGQAVAQGDLLGYGGATGKATGKHLHFEVRQGNYLADPLDVLPSAAQKLQQSTVNCASGEIAVERGGSAYLDFARTLPAGTHIIGATLEGAENTPGITPAARLIDGTSIEFSTPPHIEGAESAAAYKLDIVIGDTPRFDKQCSISVVTPARALTPYGEASYEETLLADPLEGTEDAEAESSGTDAATDAATDVTPEASPTAEATQPVEEPTAIPSETPLAIPTGIPLLGDLTSPTATPTETATPEPTATKDATPTETAKATSTATATATPDTDDRSSDDD
jgi:hypothetical protein